MIKYAFCPVMGFTEICMKVILIKMKIFFEKKSVKTFLIVFAASLPVVMGITYAAYYAAEKSMERNRKNQPYEQFYEIMSMPRSTNHNTVYEKTFFYDTNNIELNHDSNFWTGDALNHSYSLPKHGAPKN